MGNTYEDQQAKNSHLLVAEAKSQTRKINLQIILTVLTLCVSVAILIVG
jgi:hypothetical protein